jgi:hypothetical protein
VQTRSGDQVYLFEAREDRYVPERALNGAVFLISGPSLPGVLTLHEKRLRLIYRLPHLRAQAAESSFDALAPRGSEHNGKISDSP